MATLDELRREIDEIDVDLHDLLIRRVEIGREVAQAKAGESTKGPNLRPGREAQIMRRLAARNRDPLAIASVARIWREILSANLNQQVSITASVFSPEPSTNDLAREYCGTASTISITDSAAAAIEAVANGSAQIAILPGIENG
ncbi:MAG: chorismate mutase, partial [Alphaproteobacteria bacterium]|nr:chorismate mutase [Alphaproteobacteria bacterium]